MKMDAIKQEPRERVQKYFERLNKLFWKGKIQDVEQKRRFLAKLRPEIRKLCVVRTFADIEGLVGAATKVEKVMGELGETPYEPLREEQEEETSESNMEKQVNALNNALINFFREDVLNPASSSYSTMFEGCQIYRRRDHVATTCPRLNEAWLRFAKCNMPHRIKNSGSEHTFCVELGHSKDKSWKRPNDGRSHSGAVNFVEVLLNDGEVGKNAQSTDGVLGSAVEGMNEQLKEKLDNVEGLEVKCLIEEDPGILEEEKSPKLDLFLNTLLVLKVLYLSQMMSLIYLMWVRN
jgi:hypothetical protein